jgi:hypothetical protein
MAGVTAEKAVTMRADPDKPTQVWMLFNPEETRALAAGKVLPSIVAQATKAAEQLAPEPVP